MVIVLEGIQVVDKYQRQRISGMELNEASIEDTQPLHWAPLTLILDTVKQTPVRPLINPYLILIANICSYCLIQRRSPGLYREESVQSWANGLAIML
jgi:hypothetical protein